MLNDCEIEEPYSLECVQTIGLPASRQFNISPNRKSGQTTQRLINLNVMNSRQATGVPTKNPCPYFEQAKKLRRS